MKTIILVAALAVIGITAFFLWPSASGAHPLLDIDGVLHGSLEHAKSDLTALLFLGTSCPISRQYAPELASICSEFAAGGANCYLVYPEPGLTAADLKQHLRDFGHQAAILDAAHALVTKAGATITPEAAVFSRTGDLLYRGRIDDLYIALGQQRREVRTHDLRDALAALVAHKSVQEPRTQAVGCFIEGL